MKKLIRMLFGGTWIKIRAKVTGASYWIRPSYPEHTITVASGRILDIEKYNHKWFQHSRICVL